MSKRTVIFKDLSNPKKFKEQLLTWANKHQVCIVLDSNSHKNQYSSFDFLVAIDTESQLKLENSKGAFEQLKQYYNNTNDTIFGYLSYDLKNDLEKLDSKNNDLLQFPELYFFQAKKIFIIRNNKLEINYLKTYTEEIETDLASIKTINSSEKSSSKVDLINRVNKAIYLNNISKIKKDIQQGKYYEINYCQEFYSDNAIVNPLEVYKKLNSISQAPFATFFKYNKQYVLSSSPERFVKKIGDKIISQPIKGTAKRGQTTKQDLVLKANLAQDPKERAENIMIVDLVRNDMAKIAKKGTVSVPELCQIYTFDQVHQMISTVEATVAKGINTIDILSSLFPMGSMTGAPKLAAMQYIEHYEQSKRSLYASAIGYITAQGDFDFNVVIRSVLYNANSQKISFNVGGAITALSNAETEYEECMTKADAMFKVLKN
jgi:para-aminobenzoate synthetase component 1